MSTSADQWLKRQAINVVAQLPDDPADALVVLKHAERLVKTYLAPDIAPERSTPRLVRPAVGLAREDASEASLPIRA